VVSPEYVALLHEITGLREQVKAMADHVLRLAPRSDGPDGSNTPPA
jgi:hypothetical protein